MGHYNFHKDLKDSALAEEEVKTRFLKTFPRATFVRHNHDYRYDLLFDIGRPLTVEVKDDLMSYDTGNVALEYKSRGKWSDIAITEAELWAFKYRAKGNSTPRFALVQAPKLVAAWYSESFRKVVGGDPGSETHMVLIPVENFERMSRQI